MSSFMIIEPLNIKIRRAMAKLLKRDDPNVIQFDEEVKRAMARCSRVKDSETDDENEGGADA